MGRFYIPLKKGLKQTKPDFSLIKTISGAYCFSYLFANANYEGEINFSNLESISGDRVMERMFVSCSKITIVRFPKLTNTAVNYALSGAFYGCISLQHVYFNAFVSSTASNSVMRMNGMLQGVTGCVVHFPSNLQSVIGSAGNVTSGFGGTNTTVLFDLPATS